MRRTLLIAVLLMLATTAAYWPLTHADFLNFDDPVYVTNNPQVLHGLSSQGVVWAFEGAHAGFWHPLTWLSHMLDCQLFGKSPAGHHIDSLILHMLNSLLLFAVLRSMTGATWRSAMVAGLFALHPLHVESVAWISERKDVLSTFFFMLTLGAYASYTKAGGGPKLHRWGWYAATLAAFVLSLMSKPMMVTLPFLLLLLDYWPLRRIVPGGTKRGPRAWSLVAEKIPFFLLSVAACVVTYVAEAREGAIANVSQLPLSARCINAVVAYASYLGKTFVPVDLIVTYPLQATWPTLQVVIAATVLAGGSLLALAWFRPRPYAFVGWFWFVGTLVPVIGLVQVGAHSMADRYTYVPLIGFFVAVVWTVFDWLAKQRQGREVGAVAGCGILTACMFATMQQAGYWRNSETLFLRAVQVSPENYLAYHHLGLSYLTAGKFPEAISKLDQSIHFGPAYPPAWIARGTAFALSGNLDAAEKDFRENIRLKPGSHQGYFQLGKVYALQGRLDDAKTNFVEAVRLKPDYSEALILLGNVLQLQGAPAAAIPYLQTALKAQPESGEAHYYLSTALAAQGSFADAARQLQAAIQYQPDFAPAFNDLALMSETRSDPGIRDVNKGVQLAEQACKLTFDQNPAFLQTLAIAYAEAGRFSDALKAAQKALELVAASGNTELADQLRQQIARYQTNQTTR